jgi:hypothetical protein
VSAGEQKSGSTWLWEMLNAHPCLITSAQPHPTTGAITTKETYYFTSPKISQDARLFLVPWMGYNSSFGKTDAAWQQIDSNWFKTALQVANVGTAPTTQAYMSGRSYTRPGLKLQMQQCSKYYILEGELPTLLGAAACQPPARDERRAGMAVDGMLGVWQLLVVTGR